MSVASRNPFAILEDDNSRPASPTPAAAKESAPASAAPTRGSQRARGGPASRGGRYYQRGGAKPAPRDAQNGEVAEEGAEPKKRFEGGEGRGEGRGRGRGRGRGGDRGARGGRGRPFDRHSQTGKTDSDKKLHQGWGGDEGQAELKAEDSAAADAAVEASTADATGGWGEVATDGWGAPEPSTEAAAAAAFAAPAAGAEGEKAEGRRGREREAEEEDNTLTLDQYLKQKKELEAVPKLETRKANEGDDSIFKDAVVVNKKDEDETAYFVGKTKSAPKPRAKKEEKVFIEIDAHFERPQRGGRGRGGDRGDRGGDRPPRAARGRGGRGRANGGHTGGPTVDVDDQSAFPSLA